MNLYNYLKAIKDKLFKKKSYKIFPKSKSIQIAPDFLIGKYININVPVFNATITINENVIFKEFCNILVFPNAKLIIGKNVFFNNYCSLNCLHEISIGNNTLFGEGVKIYDHNHLYEKDPVIKVSADQYTFGAVSIGSNCWIGSNVTILKGVTIGNSVIIGANSLIYKSVPSNTIIKSNYNDMKVD